MNVFRAPTFWVLAAVLTLAASSFWIQNRRSKSWGFKDVVKHPERFMPDAESGDAEFQKTSAKARSWSSRQVAEKVRWFVLDVPTSRDADFDRRLLADLGEKTHHAVIGLLSDAQLYNRLITPTGTNILPETPLHRACQLLEKAPPIEAIAALAPFLDAEADGVRKSAALILGQTGQLAAVPHLRKALADPDEYVRSYVLIGLERARDGQRLSPACAEALVPDLMNLVATGKNVGAAASLLLHFAPDRASEFFLSDKIFRSDSPGLHDVIGAMNTAQAAIPRPMLRGLIDELGRDNRTLKYSEPYLLGGALAALGRHRTPEDRPTLEAMLGHVEERVAEGAGAGLISSHGLDGFEQRIWAKEESAPASLSPPQRHYLAVFACDSEINNGGISQYFFNSSGDRWKDALAGFDAMGCTERAAILREAIKPFGKSGPDENRDTRMEQLSRIYRKNDRIFDALESRYYDSKESIAVRATRYVLQNQEAFK